jgi:hypothetical protein
MDFQINSTLHRQFPKRICQDEYLVEKSSLTALRLTRKNDGSYFSSIPPKPKLIMYPKRRTTNEAPHFSKHDISSTITRKKNFEITPKTRKTKKTPW